MSQESLEQFMEKVGSNEELRASVENQLDSDGNISVDALITLGAENGCEFTTEDLMQNLELSDEELDGGAGGINGWHIENFRHQSNTSIGLNFKLQRPSDSNVTGSFTLDGKGTD